MSAYSGSAMDPQATEVALGRFNWKSLCTLGGVAALIVAGMYLITAIVNARSNPVNPVPGEVAGWFTLFQADGLTGLFYLGLADIINMIVSVPLFLALYIALRRAGPTWSLSAVALAFVGIAVYLATNTAFGMLALSHQYAAATAPEQQDRLLAAGQATLAMVEGTGGQYIGLPLTWVASGILSLVMLRSPSFNQFTAYAGIVAFPLLLASMPFAGYTTTEALPAIEAAIVAISYLGGGLLSLAWYVLVGRSLLKLGRAEPSLLEA